MGNISQFQLEQMQARLALNRHEAAPPTERPAGVERERELHDAIDKYCREKGYLARHDRMDQPTTGQVGWPDWTIFLPNTRAVFLELKSRYGKATLSQLAKLAHAKKFGFRAEITDNFDDAKRIIDEEAALKPIHQEEHP